MSRNIALVGARKRAGLSQEGLARLVRDTGDQLGRPNDCNRANVARWEDGGHPQPLYVMLLETALDTPAENLGILPGAGGLLATVPHSFSADALCGNWITCYQFNRGGEQRHHADIARVTARSDRDITAVNNPPEPRTEGRAVAFRNEIQAQLASRHLIGHWRNTSDTRYFGSVQLAVLPGETVMDGYYTGFADDILVLVSRWKWVRLESETVPDSTSLRDPAILYKLVMEHSQFDAPLALGAIREDA